jgi:hypothetical protein
VEIAGLSLFPANQIRRFDMNREELERPFPPEQIKQREGSHGQMLDYLEAHAVIQRLNDALDGDWSFEIVEHAVREEISEVIVVARLTVGEISKMQVGSAKIKRQRGTGDIINLGDDIKAATSDALKKCATLLGVGLHLYRRDDPQTDQTPAPVTNTTPPAQTQSTPRSPRTQTTSTRLSQKQHELILKLSKDHGLGLQELNARCQDEYGRVLDHLSKTDASKLIDSLLKGRAA